MACMISPSHLLFLRPLRPFASFATSITGLSFCMGGNPRNSTDCGTFGETVSFASMATVSVSR